MHRNRLASLLAVVTVVALIVLGSALLQHPTVFLGDTATNARPMAATPISGHPGPPTPSGFRGATNVVPNIPAAASQTHVVPAPTATFGPLPSPIDVPSSLPTPSGFPKILPRTDLQFSDAPQNPIENGVKVAALIVEARVVQIQTPYFFTPNHQRPAKITYQNVMSPAVLKVTKVYKGPNVNQIEAIIGGACFALNACTAFSTQYAWQDVVGYDLILFLGPPYQGDPDAVQHQYYWPFLTYIVHPSVDLALSPWGNTARPIPLSQVEARLRAALAAKSPQTP